MCICRSNQSKQNRKKDQPIEETKSNDKDKNLENFERCVFSNWGISI